MATAGLGLGRSAVLAAGLSSVLLVSPLAASVTGTPGVAVEASLSAPAVTVGTALTVRGRLVQAGAALPGTPLALEVAGYPYKRFRTVAHATSAADGSFGFTGLRLDRDSRVRVVSQAGIPASSTTLSVLVDPRVQVRAHRLGAGETRLSVRVWHARWRATVPVAASWYVAPKGARMLQMAALTEAREPAPGLTYAEVDVEPPARQFVFGVCINAPWRRAMGAPTAHRTCPQRSIAPRASVGRGEARGTPVAPYPARAAIAAARRFLDSRAGATSFAVVDNRGRLFGTRVHEHFRSASVVKVMMLIAYLQRLAAGHHGVGPSDDALLHPMIHISDNEAASAVLGFVGTGALARVAREAGMADYAPAVGWWAFTQTSAADQARLMFVLPRLIPPQFYAYARGLLAGIEPSQSWGIPPVARPRWQVFFKTGWLPSQGLFVEAARLERRGVTCATAVFTDGDPSMAYGEETIEGVASALLER
jgi:hypothetical protein